MRTLIDIPARQMEDLATICTAKKLPRTEVIRQAITAYIATQKPPAEQAFGLWGDRTIDGLKYQKKIRAEW
jgi:hypothetical protein